MSVLRKIPLIALILIGWIVRLVCLIFEKKEIKINIPKNDNKLLHTSAVDLAEKIRNKEVSSEELISTYIQRIKEVNPIINAVVEDRFREALIEAKEIDDYLKNLDVTVDLAKTKPLLGIPITVKESLTVKGLSYTGCSLTRKGIKADKDAEPIQLLKEAGAIILLVSSTPEYCTSYETYNNIIGRARNPYDTRHVTGGSSGGEGALLGSGASLIGIGTDIGGSIRCPSAFNCVYGHKPTAGIVSLDGNFPWCDDPRFAEYLVTGPMTRYAEDLKVALKVLGGDNAKKLNLDQKVDFNSINILYMEDFMNNFGMVKVDKKIKTSIKEAVAYLHRSCKCHIDNTKFPYLDETFDIGRIIFKMENSPSAFTDSKVKYSAKTEFLKFLFGKSIFTFGLLLFHFLRISAFRSEEEFQSMLKRAEEIKSKFIKALGTNNVLILPTTPTQAFEHNRFIQNLTGGRFCVIANLFGCPSTNVPIGLNKDGLPQGIQVIAGPYQDNLCIEIAKELEVYFGGWQPPY